MNLRHSLKPIAIAALLGLSACSTSGEAETAEAIEPTAQAQTEQPADEIAAQPTADDAASADQKQMMMESCPMMVEGTTRSVVQLDDAVAIDFTTTADAEELRTRVGKMAQMHQKMHSEGGHMQHGHAEGAHGEKHDEMMAMMSTVSVEAQEIDGGMRLKFSPQDPEQLGQLHQMMQKHAQKIGVEGECPMMKMMEGSTPQKAM